MERLIFPIFAFLFLYPLEAGREREFFFSFIRMFKTRMSISFFFQSRASRRERELRLRQFLRELYKITFIACLLTYIFKIILFISQIFLKKFE